MIPPAKRGGRPRDVNVREVLERDLLRAVRPAASGKALPKDLPPKSTAHYYFMLWDWDGTLERIHHALYVAVREQAGREASPTRGDHRQPERQGGAKRGASLDPQGYDAGKKVTGRKRHILVDTLGLLLNVVVHPANIQDRDGVALVLDRRTRRLFPFIERIFADGGYQGPKAARRRRDRHLDHRDRQTARQLPSLRRPAQTMDRRAYACLDQPLPPPGARLRALRHEPSPPSSASP